jgi:hypothetical protein
MKMRNIFAVFGLAAIGVTSCTSFVVYKALETGYEAVEDNTQWGEDKKINDLKEKGLTRVFEENLSGQEAVIQLKIHGFSDAQAERFPECSALMMDSRGLNTEEKVLTTKRCLQM